MGWLNDKQIKMMGFASVGENVLLSEKASYYNCGNIKIASNVRIDDFCVLSAGVGGIEIGNYIHIGVYSTLIGAGEITLNDYCNISSRVSIYSSNDDYTGSAMTNPMVGSGYTDVQHADVIIGKHVIIGSGSLILPGVSLEEGVAIGAMSLVRNSCDYFGIYAGTPAKRIRDRKKDILILEKQFIQDQKDAE